MESVKAFGEVLSECLVNGGLLAPVVPKYWSVWMLFAIVAYFYITRPLPLGLECRQQSSLDCSLETKSIQSYSTPSQFDCRNLLNKKEGGPPSTIKESSESSQTLDDNESDKGGGQLKHENTVVRADGTATKSVPSSSLSAQKQEIVRVTQQLLDAISCKDFDIYTKLCDPAMTCFEPEALGNLIEGVEFHRFYFDYGNNNPRKGQLHTTMLNPNVHVMGEEGACIAYVRLTQFMDRNGEARTRQTQESRVWQKKAGRWVCVHVHRSGPPGISSSTPVEF